MINNFQENVLIRVPKQIDFAGEKYSGHVEELSICPICKHAGKPQELSLKTFKNPRGNWFLSGMYLCNSCFQPFVTLHKCDIKDYYEYTSHILYAEPNRYEQKTFDVHIQTLSPRFVRIYNQALAAESAALDELAGLGYRKALEFLVKDFCIHLNGEDEDRIKAKPLGQCISDNIQNEKIKLLASRSAWIGNDEAHYIRKFENYDIADMKNFIQALVYYVGMELLVEEAASISPT